MLKSAFLLAYSASLAHAQWSFTQLSHAAEAKTESALVGTLRGVTDAGEKSYTTNTACHPMYCMNPIFPGLMKFGKNVLTENKKLKWECAGIQNTKTLFKLGGFCSRVLAAYPFSMPQATGNMTEADAIATQTRKALETYVGHISGMGFDFWDYTDPWKHDDECIQSVWKMSCYTHFPRCNEIHAGEYLPPCRNICENYVDKCGVICCDEGVQCVFTHARTAANGTTVYDSGYPDHKGPSPLCTGGARERSLAGLVAVGLLKLLAAIQL